MCKCRLVKVKENYAKKQKSLKNLGKVVGFYDWLFGAVGNTIEQKME